MCLVANQILDGFKKGGGEFSFGSGNVLVLNNCG